MAVNGGVSRVPPVAPPKTKTTTRKSKVSVIVIDSEGEPESGDGDESDGLEALREVEAAEVKKGRRGPSNKSLAHYHNPIPTKAPASGSPRWLFKCRNCDACVSKT